MYAIRSYYVVVWLSRTRRDDWRSALPLALILVMEIAPDVLTTLRKRAFHDGGTRRYHLHPDDLPAAYRAAVV